MGLVGECCGLIRPILIFSVYSQIFAFSRSNSHSPRIFFAGHPQRSQSSTSQGHTFNSFANPFLFIYPLHISNQRPLEFQVLMGTNLREDSGPYHFLELSPSSQPHHLVPDFLAIVWHSHLHHWNHIAPTKPVPRSTSQ